MVGNTNPYQNDVDDEWIKNLMEDAAKPIDVKLWFNDWTEAMQSSHTPHHY